MSEYRSDGANARRFKNSRQWTGRAEPTPLRPTGESSRLLVKLGRALHQYGTPSHRLEENLGLIAERLGLRANFFATPTAIFAAVEREGREESHLIRVEPADVDLGRLQDTYAIVDDVLYEEISVAEGEHRLDALVAAPPRYSNWLTVFSFGLAAAGAGRFLGGGWREIVVAAAIGLSVGVLALLRARAVAVARLFAPASAFLGSLLATSLALTIMPHGTHLSVIGGLIVLLPGLSLTLAMTELATGHLVSGTARLTGAGILFVSIGFGVAIGARCAEGMLGTPLVPFSPVLLPAWTEWVALLVAPLALTVLFQARFREIPFVAVTAWGAYLAARQGTAAWGPELGVFLGALLAGLLSNFYARALRRPASVPMVPALMMLVPGAMGFGSLQFFLDSEIVPGVELAFRVLLVAMSLVTGILVANASTRRSRGF